MLFETKKVPVETLGEYLAEVRGHIGLSIADVAEKTGIGERYLLNLEAGQYEHLPPDVYIIGFLKIFEPAPGAVLKDAVITVSGQVDPGSVVAINGQALFVDAKGGFRTTLGTAAGEKELIVTAQNRFGKQASQKLGVVVESPPAS